MTVAIETAPECLVDATARPRKSRSGSNKRQRTEQIKMSFRPIEREVLEQLASRHGFEGPGKVQQFIMLRLAGDLAAS